MKQVVETIDRMIDKKLLPVHCNILCKIVSFEKDKMRADVQPQIQAVNADGTFSDFGIIPGIPVQFIISGDYYIRPDYKKDDLVNVSFYKYQIDDILDGAKGIDNLMEYSMEAASVTGGVVSNSFTAPDNFAIDGLLIGALDDSTFININTDGLTINTTKKVTLKATGGVEITGAVNINNGNFEVLE